VYLRAADGRKLPTAWPHLGRSESSNDGEDHEPAQSRASRTRPNCATDETRPAGEDSDRWPARSAAGAGGRRRGVRGVHLPDAERRFVRTGSGGSRSRRHPGLRVPAKVFARLAYGDRDQGVVAVARTPTGTLDRLAAPRAIALVIVLEAWRSRQVWSRGADRDAVAASAVIAANRLRRICNNPKRDPCLQVPSNVVRLRRRPCAAASRRWRPSRHPAAATSAGAESCSALVDGAVPYTQVSYRAADGDRLGQRKRSGLSDVWQGPDITGRACHERRRR